MDRKQSSQRSEGRNGVYGRSREMISRAAIACLLATGMLVPIAAQIYPDTLWVPVIFYDFHADRSNPEFEPYKSRGGLKQGMVFSDSVSWDTNNADYFGMDSIIKPIHNPANTHFNRYIDYWYRDWRQTDKGNGLIPSYYTDGTLRNPPLVPVDHDTAFKNVVIKDSLPFEHLGGGVYEFRRHSFFWIDGRGFGDDVDRDDNNFWNHGDAGKNFSFAMELHTTFTKKEGITFNFSGDDDVWAFIDSELVMDIGGIHTELVDSFSVDDMPELQNGEEYTFSFFYAERCTRESHIWITTNIVSTHIVSEVTIEADPDNATVLAGDSVDFTGWVWYDSTGDDGITHHLRDSSLSSLITWSFAPADTNSSLTSTVGSQTTFTSTEAYDTFEVTATYEDETGLIVTESMNVRILPNVPDHLVVEADYDTSSWSIDMLREDQPLDTLRIPTTSTMGTAYAIIRDQYGNFVNWSQNTDWSITDGTVLAGLVGENGNVGRVTATKEGHSGVGKISGTDTDYGYVDEVPVSVYNDPIDARDDAYPAQEDATLSVRGLSVGEGVLVNDIDDDAGTIKRATLIDTIPGHFVSLAEDGGFTYVPPANFTGSVFFTYAATDGEFIDTATVTITVGGTNDAPVASADDYTTAEDEILTIGASQGVLDNDSDLDGDELRAVVVETVDPSEGTLTLNEDGAFVFTPASHFHGIARFSYVATDGTLPSAVTTVRIVVTSVNDAPIAANDAYETNEDVVLAVGERDGVLDNDVDYDGDPLSVSLVSNVANGTLVLQANGAFVYTPSANFSGSDQFTYRVTDGTAHDEGTVLLTVSAVNDAPVAKGESYSLVEDGGLSRSAANGVLTNDTDPDGPSLSAVLVDPIDASEGTLVFRANGSFDYTPPPNFNGTVVFSYLATDGEKNSPKATVVLLVHAANDKPSAADDHYDTKEDIALTVPAAEGVLANDGDIDGDGLSAALISGSGPAQGTLTLNEDGSFHYTPAPNDTGTYTFKYVVEDGASSNPLTDTGVVTISVGWDNQKPVAVDDAFSLNEDGTLRRTAINGVKANDSDPDGDATTASLVEGVGPTEGDLIFRSNGSFDYTPPENFNGTVTFRYQLSDGRSVSRIAVATIDILPVNDVPVAAADNYSIDEDKELVVPSAGVPGLLANDHDQEGDGLSVVSPGAITVSTGDLVVREGGSFVYTPPAHFNGTVTFSYRATDGNDQSNTATVTIEVKPINDAPVLSAIPNQNTTKGSPFSSIDLDDYVVDADHTDDELQWSVSGGNNIQVSIDDATHVATATVGDQFWDGTEQLVFTVTDPAGVSRTDTVSFTVSRVGTVAEPVTDTTETAYERNRHAMNLRVPNPADAVIYYTYTTDGSAPAAPSASSASLTGAGLVDFGAFTEDSTHIRVKAYAARYPYEASGIRSFDYLIVFPQLPQVVGAPAPGTHNVGELSVMLGVPGHSGVTITYT
ncbi:MAG: tandem-95 repeat protein, partial [Chitinivibrionales bacterium]|nr:tandem-95 repeat protein [Chitinivibrionales bacterium]